MPDVQCSKEEKGAVKGGWLLCNLASHGQRENAMTLALRRLGMLGAAWEEQSLVKGRGGV